MSEYYFLEDLAKKSELSINAVRYYVNPVRNFSISLCEDDISNGVKTGLIKPIGGGIDLRYFGQDAIKRLRTIKKLRRQDTSVQQVIAMMRKEVK